MKTIIEQFDNEKKIMNSYHMKKQSKKVGNHKKMFKKLLEFKSDAIRNKLLEIFYQYMSAINMQQAITYSATMDMMKPTANKKDPFHGEYSTI
jgi:hypothetical protein